MQQTPGFRRGLFREPATPARHGWQSTAAFGGGGRRVLPPVRRCDGSVRNCSLVSTGSHAR
jgi:hypothetical protein